MKSTEMKSTPVPLVEARSDGLGLRKSQSAGYGDKSQSARHGGKTSANDTTWRAAA